MDRLPNNQSARRVVEEPRPSVFPYLAAAVVVALVVWTIVQDRTQDSKPPHEQAPAIKSVERLPDSHPTRGDLRTLFTADDYPFEAERNGEQGTVQVKLNVDAAGRVNGCTVVRSSGHASLDNATCAILQGRARFLPARDSNSQPVPSEVTSPPITWRLEG